MYPELTLSPMAGFITQSRRSGTFYQICVDAKVSASTCAFSVPFALTCRSRNQRWSRFAGQFGGLAKVDSGFDYAANFSSFACLA
jgi:hypothetical protein